MEISVSQMYDIENRGHEMGFLKKFMMENAGAAAVRVLADNTVLEGKRVLVFAGTGNNGGDGLVMARHLAGYGSKVTVSLPAGIDSPKTEESRWNLDLLKRMPSVRIVSGVCTEDADVMVDALLGTGIAGRIREPYASAIRHMNGSDCLRMAVDVPSGMDPQTGDTADPHTTVHITVTFHRIKHGISKRPGITGAVHVAKIGIPPEAEGGIL